MMKIFALMLVMLIDFIFPLWCFLFFRKHIKEIHTKWICSLCIFLNHFLGFLLVIHNLHLIILFTLHIPAFLSHNLFIACNVMGFICMLVTGLFVFPKVISIEEK